MRFEGHPERGAGPAIQLATFLIASALAWAASACGSSSKASAPGGGGPGPDLTPPSINAAPPGGDYPEDVLVTLFSDEAATIYYTVDGGVPTIGGASTSSGSAPVVDVAIEGAQGAETTRLLQYFGVDARGNVGPLLMKLYTIDRVVPEVSQQGADPAPIGILDSALVSWSASDDGSFRVELGGDGTPESGMLVDSGTYSEPGTVVHSEVPGALLQPSGDGELVHVIVTDAAGNRGSAELQVRLREFASTNVPAGVLELALAPHPFDPSGTRLYVATASEAALFVLDASTLATLGTIELACPPTGLAALPNGSRVYVGCAGSIVEVDPSTLEARTTLPVPSGGLASGLSATPSNQRVYFGSSVGELMYIDVPSQQIHSTNIADFPIERCRIAITPAPATAKGLVAWKGAGLYGVFSFDAATGTLFGSSIPPTPLDPPGAVAVSPSVVFERGFVGDFANRLARVSLLPPALEQFVADSSLWGVAAVPGTTTLVLTHAGDLALELRGAEDLAPIASYDLAPLASPSAEAGLALPLAIDRVVEQGSVVTRGWFVHEQGARGAQLLRVPLATAPL